MLLDLDPRHFIQNAARQVRSGRKVTLRNDKLAAEA